MQCLILAGGLGTRMLPATREVAKAMLPVAGEPFVHHQLSLLARQGVERVVYSIGYLGSQIREFAGDGSRWGLRVAYSDEGERLLGTAGAIRLAADAGLLEDGFFTLYGDSYVRADLRALWRASGEGARCVMTVLRNDGHWDRSNVVFRDGRLLLYHKGQPDPAALGMRHIDHGLLVLTRRTVLERVEPGRSADLAELLHALSVEGSLMGFEVFERFFEIGSPEGLEQATEFLLAKAE